MKKIYIVILGILLFCTGCGGKEQVISVDKTVPQQEEKEQRVSFYGAGDNLIHNCVYWQADNNAPGEDYDFKPMYSKVADDIKNADIAYINQETILGGTELGLSSYPLFNSPQELGCDMIELGFDVFSHATNHVFDKGEKGVANTYAFYRENPQVTVIGIYEKGEESIKIVERKGIKTAFVNYTYHTNGLGLPDDSEYVVNVVYGNDCTNVINDVKKAKEQADFVICCLHWGNEGETTPSSIQKEHAQLLSKAGADVIIGTHPHTIQPVEFIDDTLVVYSLGNFISAQNNGVNLVGGTVKFDMVIKGMEKKIENVEFIPVINQYEGFYSNIRIIPFKEYSQNLAASHGAFVRFEYFSNLIEKTIDSAYLKF